MILFNIAYKIFYHFMKNIIQNIICDSIQFERSRLIISFNLLRFFFYLKIEYWINIKNLNVLMTIIISIFDQITLFLNV